jgi:ABC-type multidrug transport system fused ATPase/permease subunit
MLLIPNLFYGQLIHGSIVDRITKEPLSFASIKIGYRGAISSNDGSFKITIREIVSTIKSVDRIVFLKRGQVQEVGTHQELINLKGDYNSLWQLQHQDLMI